MRKIKFEELKKIKEFKLKNEELVWSPFVIDEFMGFTIFRIRATKDSDGLAQFKYTEEYVMSGRDKEKECIDQKYISIMKDALEKMINAIVIEKK